MVYSSTSDPHFDVYQPGCRRLRIEQPNIETSWASGLSLHIVIPFRALQVGTRMRLVTWVRKPCLSILQGLCKKGALSA